MEGAGGRAIFGALIVWQISTLTAPKTNAYSLRATLARAMF